MTQNADSRAPRRIVIVAGNYRQAQDHARRERLAPGWIYPSHASQLRGLVNPEVRYVGTFWDNPHITEIDKCLRYLLPPNGRSEP